MTSSFQREVVTVGQSGWLLLAGGIWQAMDRWELLPREPVSRDPAWWGPREPTWALRCSGRVMPLDGGNLTGIVLAAFLRLWSQPTYVAMLQCSCDTASLNGGGVGFTFSASITCNRESEQFPESTMRHLLGLARSDLIAQFGGGRRRLPASDPPQQFRRPDHWAPATPADIVATGGAGGAGGGGGSPGQQGQVGMVFGGGGGGGGGGRTYPAQGGAGQPGAVTVQYIGGDQWQRPDWMPEALQGLTPAQLAAYAQAAALQPEVPQLPHGRRLRVRMENRE